MTSSEEDYEFTGDEFQSEDDDIRLSSDENNDEPSFSDKGIYGDNLEYRVLSTEQIVKHMTDCIEESNAILQLSPTILRMLLQQNNWNKEKLMESYYGGLEQLFKNAQALTHPTPSVCKKKKESDECNICFVDMTPDEMFNLNCGHGACVDCWRSYLTTKIVDDGIGQINCIGYKCPILVDDAAVMNLIEDANVKLKYQHLITESFVQSNKRMKWCPSPGCTNAILVEMVDWKPVTCKCGNTFCFLCTDKWHEPIKCAYLRKWTKKLQDDSETSHWIVANTKECPKCHATIEKNGGCNHMACRNVSCNYQFCWICLGQWGGTHNYECNRFNDGASDGQNAQERSRAALKRYLHYNDRYVNHERSLNLEALYETVSAKMQHLQEEQNMSWTEVQFLQRAVDILGRCRRTLMYTYAFAFYLQKNSQAAIFEDNQSDLESAVEELSGLLERDIATEPLLQLIPKVKNKYVYCESRRQALVKHVYEGYEEDSWEFTESAQ